MNKILNTEDIIYRRDIISRIKYFERLKGYSSLMWNLDKELESLISIIDQAGGCHKFEDGEPLISEHFFTEYGKDESDYLKINFDGTTYFMRIKG